MVLKIFANVERILDTIKINVPHTDRIYIDVTIIKYSAPERTLYVNGKHLGEHALLLMFAEHTALLDNIAIIKLNVLILNYHDTANKMNKRNYCPEEQNMPPFYSQKLTLSCNDMRSANFHFILLLGKLPIDIF